MITTNSRRVYYRLFPSCSSMISMNKTRDDFLSNLKKTYCSFGPSDRLSKRKRIIKLKQNSLLILILIIRWSKEKRRKINLKNNWCCWILSDISGIRQDPSGWVRPGRYFTPARNDKIRWAKRRTKKLNTHLVISHNYTEWSNQLEILM